MLRMPPAGAPSASTLPYSQSPAQSTAPAIVDTSAPGFDRVPIRLDSEGTVRLLQKEAHVSEILGGNTVRDIARAAETGPHTLPGGLGRWDNDKHVRPLFTTRAFQAVFVHIGVGPDEPTVSAMRNSIQDVLAHIGHDPKSFVNHAHTADAHVLSSYAEQLKTPLVFYVFIGDTADAKGLKKQIECLREESKENFGKSDRFRVQFLTYGAQAAKTAKGLDNSWRGGSAVNAISGNLTDPHITDKTEHLARAVAGATCSKLD